jgi:methyl-accepting chemotaxis protein
LSQVAAASQDAPVPDSTRAAAPAPGGGAGGPEPAVAAPARRRRVGLTTKIVGAAGLSIALVAVILAVSFAREVRGLLEEQLTTRGRMAGLALANTTTSLVFAQDVTGLEALAAATLADVPGAAYVVIRDETGRTIAEAALAALGAERPPAPDLAALNLGDRLVEKTLRVAGAEMLEVAALVSFSGKADVQYLDPLGLETAGGAGNAGTKVLGSVQIGFPLAELTGQISAASRRSLSLAALAFGACLLVMIPLARVLTRPIGQLSRAALGIAQGDLRQVVSSAGNDEVADLGESFSKMTSELQAMLRELQEAAQVLGQESEDMLGGATRQAAMASQQSASVAEMNVSVREIAHTASAALDQADRVLAVTHTAEESSRAGAAVVEEAVASTAQVERHVGAIGERLGDLSGRVGQIGEIIETVEDLAQQTNVLALNAAIQAAHGGEAGKGFVVIAREMRTLAEKSGAAASGVPRLLGEIVASTRAAAAATQQGSETARGTAALARRAGEAIGNLAGVSRESAAAASQIAVSARQQATGVNEIVAALAQLARAADGSVEGGEEMRRAAERLSAVSARLTSLAQRYRS